VKIAILSRSSKIYSTNRLVLAAIKRGHEVEVIDPLKCYMDITSKNPMIHYMGRTLENFDAVIPRIGASITFYGKCILVQLELMGVYPVN
jgi:ribosomal protein S6--L-glutamate ligase